MKCPICGAPSEVARTKEVEHNMIHRRRLCFNMHRFNTYEMYEAASRAAGKNIAASGRRAATSAETWARNRLIIRSSDPASVVAKKFGISDARVRQIRAAAAATHPGVRPGDNPSVGSSDTNPKKGNRA